MRDAHDKAIRDMTAAVEAKEKAHVQEMNDLERKFLMDKGNLQKVVRHKLIDALHRFWPIHSSSS